MLILTRTDIQQLIRMEPVIAAVEAAHGALARGAAAQAVDEATILTDGVGVMLPMAAAIGSQGVAGVKVLTDIRDNPGRGLPTQQSTITVIDPETGRCRGFLDGIEITTYRTAAASAVATRHLAPESVGTLGLIGAGAQARSHLRALMAVRDFEQVTVWSRNPETAEAFADDQASCGLPITVLPTAEAVVRSADVLCTLTPAREPYILGEWFGPGLHVNAVGAPPLADHREVDSTGIARSLVVVDDLETSVARSGELLSAIAEGVIDAGHVHGDLGQVVAGLRPGRTSPDQITLFNSVGLAIQDMAAASLLLDLAEAEGVGLEIDLSAVAARG